MAGINPKFSGGPITYPVLSKVAGGQVVQANTGGVEPADADSATVVGVALIDAIPSADVTALADDFGLSIIATDAYPEYTTVAQPNDVVPVTFAADATFGAFVKAAASGTVTPWVSGTDDASLIIGKVMDVDGVTVSSNAVGNIRLA